MPNVNQTILKKDAQGNVLQESYIGDMAFRGEYDGSGNIIYKAYARPGADEGALVWQICLLTYIGENVVSITWPQNEFGAATSEFNYSWADRASYTYS